MSIKILAFLLLVADTVQVFRFKAKGDIQSAIFYLILSAMVYVVLIMV